VAAQPPDTDEETRSFEDEGPDRLARWRTLFVAILVGLLAGVLAAFLTTRLLHGSWLPGPPAGVVGQTTGDYRAILETFGDGPHVESAADPEIRQELQSLSGSASGKAPIVSVGAL
jgi:uncharacterized membrane protein YeaQ/YmgE (transglycosylase-associated protein family)